MSSRLQERNDCCYPHGAYSAYSELKADQPGMPERWSNWSGCPLCKQERESAALLGAGIPPRFAEVTFDAFDAASAPQRSALKACSDFAAAVQGDAGGGLLLLGPPGTGKSMLAATIVHSVIVRRGLSARFVGARGLVRELRDTWRRGAERSEADAIDALVDVHLLVIDDVGVGFGTDAEQTQLLDVIDGRYQRRRPTVCTSNLNLPGLANAIGQRAFDRLKEDATVVLFDWPSRRQLATTRREEA
jgi:DNA replication protein DnaC